MHNQWKELYDAAKPNDISEIIEAGEGYSTVESIRGKYMLECIYHVHQVHVLNVMLTIK